MIYGLNDFERNGVIQTTLISLKTTSKSENKQQLISVGNVSFNWA